MNYYLLKEYFLYWLYCLDDHSLHSPFVYDLYTKIIKTESSEVNIQGIEDLRSELLTNDQIINTRSFGASSTISSSKKRKVSNIAKGGISSKKYSQLYYSLIRHFELQNIWEIGTSLGLNTLYLSSVPETHVTTFEGCHETLQIAENNFQQLKKPNITAVEGNLDQTLQNELGKIRTLDFVFFDANHRLDPTLEYFESCLSKTHPGTIFVFDDIHWSAEMNNAWQQIRAHPLSRLTLDLFQAGIVFFDPELPKQHFILDF